MAHPPQQGLFKDSTMRLIPAFEASPKGYADLYQTVLVDTPIGPYFSQFLEQQQERLTNAAQVHAVENRFSFGVFNFSTNVC